METINFEEYKYWYINKDAKPIYVGQDEMLDPASNQIGVTCDDYKAGAWVLLTEEQIAFAKKHPDATVEEVYNMQLELELINPEPETPPGPDPLQTARQIFSI